MESGWLLRAEEMIGLQVGLKDRTYQNREVSDFDFYRGNNGELALSNKS